MLATLYHPSLASRSKNVTRRNKTLKGMLDEYKAFPGLALHWIFLGSSGRETRPQAGGVLRHYTHCNTQPHIMIKLIANAYYVRNFVGHPHNPLFWCEHILLQKLQFGRASVLFLHTGARAGRHDCRILWSYAIQLSTVCALAPAYELDGIEEFMARLSSDKLYRTTEHSNTLLRDHTLRMTDRKCAGAQRLRSTSSGILCLISMV